MFEVEIVGGKKVNLGETDLQFWTRSSGPAVSVQPTSCQQGQQQFPPMILLPSTPLFNDIINSVIKEGNGRKLLV